MRQTCRKNNRAGNALISAPIPGIKKAVQIIVRLFYFVYICSNIIIMAQDEFYYDPILGLQYYDIKQNNIPEPKLNRSERRKLKFGKNK